MSSEFVVILASALVAAAIFWPVQKRMAAKTQSAEAQMHLSQISTLEKAYYTEYGHYIGFSEYYGAPLQGEDRCRRPAGADELGFRLRWCLDQKGRGEPLRYAYAVELLSGGAEGFRAHAISGSDAMGHSMVCTKSDGSERWQVEQDKRVVKILSCP